MKRLVALGAVAMIALGGGVAVAASQPAAGQSNDHRIPSSIRRVGLTELNGANEHVVRAGEITGSRAKALVKDFNALNRRPPGPYACPADRGLRRVARFAAGGTVWVANEGFCGAVTVVRDGQRQHALSDSKAFASDLKADLATIRPTREHVPTSLRTVELARRNQLAGPITRRRTVTGHSAAKLVETFDSLALVPRDAVHCNVAGGPQTIVRFRTKSHRWDATESACTNVVVTRDGKPLPTLIGSAKWERLVQRELRN
ncbi:MAG TPA: hypothetical protein VHV79_08455 [Mycobacteriales bacterium]|nr:hypothetical protein [Mycobacteriales bacterium]